MHIISFKIGSMKMAHTVSPEVCCLSDYASLSEIGPCAHEQRTPRIELIIKCNR